MPLTSSVLHTNPRPTLASTIFSSGNACLSPGHHGLNHLLLKPPDTFQTSPVNPQPHHLHQQQQDLITPLATTHILLLGIAATSHKHILPLAATPLFSLPIHHFSPPKRKCHIAAAHDSVLPFRTSTHQQNTILFFPSPRAAWSLRCSASHFLVLIDAAYYLEEDIQVKVAVLLFSDAENLKVQC